MCRLALANGVSMKSIESSVNLAYHELPETLPFSKEFTRLYQARFMNEYMQSKERLLHLLPYQVKTLGQEELIEKYDSYFPQEIKDKLKNRGFVYNELYKKDVNISMSDGY